MRVYITNINGQSMVSTAQIAQNMVTDIGVSLGYRELGIYCYPIHADSPSELSKRLDGIVAGLRHGDVVVFQVPTWNTTAFDEAFMNKLKLFNIKIAIFIHDVVPLMFESNFYLMEQTIRYFNRADLIIAPSQSMLDKLYEHGLTVKQTIIQRMWDHPTTISLETASLKREIHFPGSPDRFSFVQSWDYDIPLHLYAHKDVELPANVIKEPWLSDDNLLKTFSKGGFGLIWMDDHDKEYQSMYCPYKLGTFLAAGIPVIVQRGIANQELITKNHLGMVVDSLDEAVKRIREISQADYQSLVQSVREFNVLVRQGYFTRRLLTETVFQVLQK